jgi:hypothetical protein
MNSVEPAKLAYKVFLEALRKGFPMEFKVLGANALLVKSDRGMGVLYSRVIESDDGVYLEASADLFSVWYVKIGKVENDDLTEMYLAAVPAVLSQHPHLISSFEVDVWIRRFSLLERLKPAGKVPPILAPYRVWGARVYELPDTSDYAAVKGDVILAWYNSLTEKLDDATKYQIRMGLLR